MNMVFEVVLVLDLVPVELLFGALLGLGMIIE